MEKENSLNEELNKNQITESEPVETDDVNNKKLNETNPEINNEQKSDENEQENEYKTKYEELNDKYLRLYSEYDNYRRRTAKEKTELMKTAGADIIKSILPVLDDFERAIKANESINEPETLKEGFVLIHNKLNNIMQAKGLKAMNLIDTEFNADISEAIANLPAEDETKKGKVIDVVENGYYLNDVVIRYAKVVVGA